MESKQYHDCLMATENFPPRIKMHKWKPTGRREMYIFLCVAMSMAHVKKYRMKDRWTKSMPTTTPAFAHMMPQDRFFCISKTFSLH